jgi:hypothetical protein
MPDIVDNDEELSPVVKPVQVGRQCPPFTMPSMENPPVFDVNDEITNSPALLANSLYNHKKKLEKWSSSNYTRLLQVYRRYRKLCNLQEDTLPDKIPFRR